MAKLGHLDEATSRAGPVVFAPRGANRAQSWRPIAGSAAVTLQVGRIQINPLHTDQIRVEAFQRCLLSEVGESRAYTYSAAQVPRSVTTGQVGLRQSQGAQLGSPVSARSRERGGVAWISLM